MSAIAQQRDHSVPVVEYLRREALAEHRSEFDEGRVIAMAGASRNHNQIVLNIAGALNSALRDRPCNVYSTDLRVAVQTGSRYFYPDVVIACGKEEYQTDAEPLASLLNPVAVIEVLSPSTEARDRGEKFLCYQTVPTLREYILVSQWPRRFESYYREESGVWIYRAEPKNPEFLEVRSIAEHIPAKDVYNKAEEKNT